MTREEVAAILGEPHSTRGGGPNDVMEWYSGRRDYIGVLLENGKVQAKALQLPTVWENLKWYATKYAAKIGIRWD